MSAPSVFRLQACRRERRWSPGRSGSRILRARCEAWRLAQAAQGYPVYRVVYSLPVSLGSPLTLILGGGLMTTTWVAGCFR